MEGMKICLCQRHFLSNYANISIALMILVNKKSFNIQRGHEMWFCMSFVSIASTINVGAVGNRISMYVDLLQQLLSCVNVMKKISKHDLSHSSFDAKGIDTRVAFVAKFKFSIRKIIWIEFHYLLLPKILNSKYPHRWIIFHRYVCILINLNSPHIIICTKRNIN